MCEALAVSERRACRVLGQVRRTQRYAYILSDDETALVAHVVSLATEYGRYGYRRITALLRADGWPVNHKRVERIWRQEGLKVPARQPKRGRLWFNDGSCIRLRPQYRNQVPDACFVPCGLTRLRSPSCYTSTHRADLPPWNVPTLPCPRCGYVYIA